MAVVGEPALEAAWGVGFQLLDIAAVGRLPCHGPPSPCPGTRGGVLHRLRGHADPDAGRPRVLDSGLVGALVLYGFSPAASVIAMLAYHAISVWVPGLGGVIAWLPTRARAWAGTAPAPHPEFR